MGAAVVSELDGAGAPPIQESASWFVERHVANWSSALEMARSSPLVVLDGDPFKGLWYNPVFREEGWPPVETMAALYRNAVERGQLEFPDMYLVLSASEIQLRERQASDSSRKRRRFEKHLRLVEPQRSYFAHLQSLSPERVQFLDTAVRINVVGAALANLPSHGVAAGTSVDLLADMAAFASEMHG